MHGLGATDNGEPSTSAESLAERLIEALAPALELLCIEFGRRLGLYEALARMDGTTSSELATAAAIHERIAREWLDQQATAGFIDVVGALEPPDTRRFRLSPAQRAVFLEPDHPAYALGAGTMFAGTASAFDAVVDAAHTGNGVPYGAFGTGVRHGLEQLNRPGT